MGGDGAAYFALLGTATRNSCDPSDVTVLCRGRPVRPRERERGGIQLRAHLAGQARGEPDRPAAVLVRRRRGRWTWGRLGAVRRRGTLRWLRYTRENGPAASGDRVIHWVDLHTGPITWQIRDQAGLHSVTEILHLLDDGVGGSAGEFHAHGGTRTSCRYWHCFLRELIAGRDILLPAVIYVRDGTTQRKRP